MYTSQGKVNKYNHLEIGGCDVVELVINCTPLYVMDESLIRKLSLIQR